MVDDIWWIFSENHEPRKLIGNLYPKEGAGLVRGWAYLVQKKKWFYYSPNSSMWYSGVYGSLNIPKQFETQLFLLGV